MLVLEFVKIVLTKSTILMFELSRQNYRSVTSSLCAPVFEW